MPDVFISYSAKDSQMAQSLFTVLRIAGIQPFLAEISVTPGQRWKDEILRNLRASTWFLFLATPNAVASDAVKHEIGGALALNKNLVSILVGISPSQLPDWIKDRQAVDSSDPERFRAFLEGLGKKIRSEKALTAALVVALVLFFVYIFTKK
jgi:hypothetical protein